MDERPSRLKLVIDLVVILGVFWTSLPTHQRQEILLRTVNNGQKLTEKAARYMGRAGMRAELYGDNQHAADNYEAAYTIMTGANARLGKMYQDIRGGI